MNGFDVLNKPLSEQEMTELEVFLMSENSNSITIDALDGFFTALAVGPATLLPSEWIPLVLGTQEADAFTSVEQAQCMIPLLIRYTNSLNAAFQVNPDKYTPIFDCCTFETIDEEADAVTSWALGFMLGVEQRYEKWEPIFVSEDEEREESPLIISPIILLAGEVHDAHQLTAMDREILQELVAESVIKIYRFWQTYRPHADPMHESGTKTARIIPFDQTDVPPCHDTL